MLDVEQWAQIRRMHVVDGVSIKEIARRTGLARNTVRAALRSEKPPSYERGPRVTEDERGIRSLGQRVDPERGVYIAAHQIARIDLMPSRPGTLQANG